MQIRPTGLPAGSCRGLNICQGSLGTTSPCTSLSQSKTLTRTARTAHATTTCIAGSVSTTYWSMTGQIVRHVRALAPVSHGKCRSHRRLRLPVQTAHNAMAHLSALRPLTPSTLGLDKPSTGRHHHRNSPKCCNDPLSRQHIWGGLSHGLVVAQVAVQPSTAGDATSSGFSQRGRSPPQVAWLPRRLQSSGTRRTGLLRSRGHRG